MRYLLPALVCLAGTAARGDEGIPPSVLADIKNATVFIKGESGGSSWSGSGFLVKGTGETGYLVTNQHVAAGPRAAARSTLTLVFASGTRKERAVRADVLTADADNDLALLRVTGVKDLPRPIDLSQTPPLSETMPVFIVGFPLGQMLA